jgi:hypothetical protein
LFCKNPDLVITIHSLLTRTTIPALLLLLVTACQEASAQSNSDISLVSHQVIPGFPSASSIIVYKKKLFVTGDDSRDVLVLDEQYNRVDSIRIFDNAQRRIDRQTKADLESAVLVGGFRKKLLLIGSASSDVRKKSLLIPLGSCMKRKMRLIDNEQWLNSIDKNLTSLNIEGAAVVGNRIFLGNRRMKDSGPNYLIIGALKTFLKGESENGTVKELVFPDSINAYAGISDLCYVKSLNTLFVTFTSEDTTDPTKDGAIGDSYLAWISGFREKVRDATLRLNGVIDLSKFHSVFKSQKIEGISADPKKRNEMVLHLVSDNDDGTSRIFKLKMILH